eukprot:g1750.t1
MLMNPLLPTSDTCGLQLAGFDNYDLRYPNDSKLQDDNDNSNDFFSNFGPMLFKIDNNSVNNPTQNINSIDGDLFVKKKDTNIQNKMINKLYDAHLEHNHKTKVNVLLYYLEGIADTDDILVGDLKTKRFLYDIVAYSMPQSGAWQMASNVATAVKLFEKFCKYDEEFRCSALCLQMANDIFLRIQQCFENKNHKMNNFKTSDSWLRTIQIRSKYDEKALLAFCNFFKFVKDNNIFDTTDSIRPTESNKKGLKYNDDAGNKVKEAEDSLKAIEMEKFHSEISKTAIYMHCYNGNFYEAKTLFRQLMLSEKYNEKTIIAFVRLFLSQCTKEKRSIYIEDVLGFVTKETGVKYFDGPMYRQIFRACLKARKTNTAVKHIKACRKGKNNSVDDGIYSLMIRCCRMKHKALALELYNEYKDIANKKNNPVLDDKVNVSRKIYSYAKSFAALLDCYMPLQNNEDAKDFQMFTTMYEELHFDLHNSLLKAIDSANDTSGSISNNDAIEKNIQACQRDLNIMYTAYFKKCLEYKKYSKIIEIYKNELKDNNNDKKTVVAKVSPPMYTYILRAVMLQKLTRGKKHFKRGLKFYSDEIRTCGQEKVPLSSLDYHHILLAFQRDFSDNNSIHIANEADFIFKDALEEQVINIFPGIKGDWRSQEGTTINMCDLHSIHNRQTALVTAKYICKYFDKEKYGNSDKTSFGIIVGRGRFQEENAYSKIICKYLDHEKIQYHTNSGIIYLNWSSVMKWRNS